MHEPDARVDRSHVGCRMPRAANRIDSISRRSHGGEVGSSCGEELDRLAGAKAVARLKPFHQPPPSFHPFACSRSFTLSSSCTRDSLLVSTPSLPLRTHSHAAWNHAAGLNSLREVFLVSFETHGEEGEREG